VPRTHYETLGVKPNATRTEIKSAYRSRMRTLHPDVRKGPADHGELAAVAEAWNVLSDTRRRATYDAGLSSPSTSSAATFDDVSRFAYRPGVDLLTPPKFPWKLVVVIAVVGIAAVLILAAFSKPSGPQGPDNLLQSGSCVDIASDGAAFEVSCDGPHQRVVRQLVAFDETCPLDTEPHRDRQGMGMACTVAPAG
jgi:curved DNA-binding protein CbpA